MTSTEYKNETKRFQVSKRNEAIFMVFVYAIITLFVVVCTYPFMNILAYSLSSNHAILSGQVTLYPIGIQFDTYNRILNTNLIINALRISATVTVLGTLLSMVVTIMAAYALSKRRLKGRAFFTIFILFTLYFSGGIIPTFMVVNGLGLLNSIGALIFPITVSAFNFIIMKAFFQSLPMEIEESATIDGCSDMLYLVRMALPLSKPILATIALFYAVMYWNDYFSSLLYINEPRMYPLQILLRQLLFTEALTSISTAENIGQQVMPESMKASVVVIAIVPIVMIYPWLQKYFVKGIMLGSIKG